MKKRTLKYILSFRKLFINNCLAIVSHWCCGLLQFQELGN